MEGEASGSSDRRDARKVWRVHIGSTSVPASAGTPVASRLAQAKQMLVDGLISDSEYEAIKAKIVSEI